MNKGNTLKGKRILITSYSYASFGGAELNAVELADQLVQFGMKPTFFSYDIDGPLKSFIEKRFDTKVLTDRVNKLAETEADLGVTSLDMTDYDFVWVGGNTFPISLIRQVNLVDNLPKFIFIHMSQLKGFPLDAPLMTEFEKQIASSILSISAKTTTDNIHRILGVEVEVDDWPNPVPKDFSVVPKRRGSLGRVAVISSSHPSEEIIDIKSALEERGITIDYVGRFNDNVKVVDASFYDQYDLIIGIGKNARYSLVSGVPIYVYGRFGGGGYLNDANFELNETYNFSGRGFGKKKASVIAAEIVDGYLDALQFHEMHKEEFVERLSLDKVAYRLFKRLAEQESIAVKFDDEYINWLVTMQINLLQRSKLSGLLRAAEEENRTTQAMLEKERDELTVLRSRLDGLNKKMNDILKSRSWRLTKALRRLNSRYNQLHVLLRKYSKRHK